jgi:TolA-binding protein
MDKKFTMVAIVLMVILIAVGGVLIGRSLVGRGGDSNMAALLDEKTRELEDKNRQIQDLEKQAEQLRKDLEESSKQMADLQNRVDQTNRGLASMQERLKTAKRPSSASRDTMASAPPGASTDAGSYETLRETHVYAEPSSNSKVVARIAKGSKVNVARSAGDWLEVWSKRGNPPGFIRREDARYVGAN